MINGEKEIEKKQIDVSLGTLYDVNKSIVNSMKKLSIEEIEEKTKEMITFIEQHLDNYYMLLCRERNDYTIFHKTLKDNSVIIKELLECLDVRGVVKGFDITPDEYAYEIWITSEEENESYCYYFFPYGTAIVEC